MHVPLAAFRILFGLCLLGDVAQLFSSRHLISDPVPSLSRSSINPALLLAAWLIAVACVIVGYRTRIASLVNYILVVALLGYSLRDLGFGYAADIHYLAGSLALLVIPSGEALSLNHLLARRRAAVFGQPFHVPRRPIDGYVNILVIILASLYFDAAWSKSGSSRWTAGLEAWVPVNAVGRAVHGTA